MSFNKNITNAYATADHKMGRVGTAVAATGLGAGVGAGVAFMTSGNLLAGTGIGAASGIVAEEAGRLFVDEEVYQLKRLELNLEETVKVAAKFF